MAVLASSRCCISLGDLVDQLRQGRIPSGKVCVTFDDGYLDNLQIAKPILERFLIPATFFLTSGYLEGDREFWWDALERPFFHKIKLPTQLCLDEGPGNFWFDLGEDADYRSTAFASHRDWRAWDPPLSKRHRAYSQTWEVLFRASPARRGMLLGNILGWAEEENQVRSDHQPMSWGDVRKLISAPLLEIGGHTISHPALPKLDVPTQETEIKNNKLRLEALSGRRLRYFSYPHGEHNAETVRVVRQAGFEAALTTEAAAVPRSPDLFRLPRICAGDWAGEEFENRLEAGFSGN
jgi:peptidoglycan/xylan/chitin deacetylase (PgdA/CDA1 family)